MELYMHHTSIPHVLRSGDRPTVPGIYLAFGPNTFGKLYLVDEFTECMPVLSGINTYWLLLS